jgi:hypothetical protein
MKRTVLSTFAATLLFFVACEPPGAVLVREELSGVEVTSLVRTDTSFGTSPIDTSGLLPGDELEYPGSMILNHVRVDAGFGVESFSFARVFVGDSSRPIPGRGGTIGFHGFHLGTIRLNNVPMIEKLHRLPGIDTVVTAGFEYVGGPNFAYVAGQTYALSGDSVESAGLSIDAPELITVKKPEGGSTINIDQPLELEWVSEGEIVIIVSRVIRAGIVRPMLYLRPLRNGYAVVSEKVLQLLPRNGTYILTFIRSNRKEVTVERPLFQGTILVQAASVHNTVVQSR